MAEKEQATEPLAQATVRPINDVVDEECESAAPLHIQKTSRRKRCIICCGCIAATVLILVVVILILVFTVFRVKDPTIKMNSISVTRLELINRMTPMFGINMSLAADVSVKNPNVASFKYKNMTIALFYRGVDVGEVQAPPGMAKARRTVHMNVTADIIVDRLMSNVPDLVGDLSSGLLPVGAYTRAAGRVKMLGIINKHVVVRLNCTLVVNISSLTIQDLNCKRKVSL